MKFNYKKVASVLASAAMIGSTMGVAFAATYPTPFVSGGSSDVAIVVGSGTGAEDTIAASDIGVNLATKVTTSVATGTTTATSACASDDGTCVLLEKQSSKVNMGDTLSNIFGTSVTDSYLKTLLASGTYTDDVNSDFKYDQKLTLGNALQLGFFADSSYKSSLPTTGINLSSSAVILNYTLDFTTDPYFEPYTKIETTTLTLLGKKYYVLDATNSSSTNHKLTLLDSANEATVAKDETVTQQGKQVSIKWMSSTQVKFLVDGEETGLLDATSTTTFKLKDGTYIGVKEIMYNAVAGEIGQATFSIGSGKLIVQNSQQVQLNDVTIPEITGYIITSEGSKIDKIVLEWKTNEDSFITPGSELLMPAFKAVKLSMEGMVEPKTEITKVSDGSDSYINLVTTIKDSAITLPILYTNGSGDIKGIGKGASDLLYSRNGTTNLYFNESGEHKWTVLSWNTTRDYESYVLKMSVSQENGINYSTIWKMSAGDWTEVCKNKKPGDTCDVGSTTITLNNVQKVGSDKWTEYNISEGSAINYLYTKDGLKVYLPFPINSTANGATTKGSLNVTTSLNQMGSLVFLVGTAGNSWDSFYLEFQEADKTDNVGIGVGFNVTIDKTGNKVEVSTISPGGVFSEIVDTNNQIGRVVSDLATQVRRIGDSSSQREAEITYYGGEVYGKFYISAPSTTIGSGSGVTILPVLDTQLSSVNTKNLIVVGGSCVNTVAATLLGSSTALCGSAWSTAVGASAGEYVIRTYSNAAVTSKLATLVAGWAKEDTANAAQALTTSTSIEIASGKNYKGTTASNAALVA